MISAKHKFDQNPAQIKDQVCYDVRANSFATRRGAPPRIERATASRQKGQAIPSQQLEAGPTGVASGASGPRRKEGRFVAALRQRTPETGKNTTHAGMLHLF
jgi:hypothetical protein